MEHPNVFADDLGERADFNFNKYESRQSARQPNGIFTSPVATCLRLWMINQATLKIISEILD